MDHLVKAAAEGVRVHAAVTTDLVNEAMRRHGCLPLAAAALGRTMTGALLLAANLKNRECLTVKFQGGGPLGRVTADASAEGAVRGYVAHPRAELPLTNGKLSVGQGIGRGLLSVTRFTGLKTSVTGTCEIFSGEIAEDFTRYLLQSEQTPSSVGLGVRIGTDGRAESAGGFLVQPMPGAQEDVLSRLEAAIAALRPVSEMVRDGLSARDIVAEVLRGFSDIRFFDEMPLAFRCQCSRQRTADILMTLGADDLAQLVQDGEAEVCCDFCGTAYRFNRGELLTIAREAEQRRAAQRDA